MYQLYVEKAKSKTKKSIKAAKEKLIERVFGDIQGHALKIINDNCIEESNKEENFGQVSIWYDKNIKAIYNRGSISIKDFI